MTTEYSVSIDWHHEFRKDVDKWVNHGQRVAREILEDREHPLHREFLEELGHYEEPEYPEDIAYENFEPVMNYGYPLFCEPADEDILRIIRETCLTVMENTGTGDNFLVLCGGGMDLSQSIALAYILSENRIPAALAYTVSIQEGLNFSGEKFRKVMEACREELELAGKCYAHQASQIRKAIAGSVRKGGD